LVQERDGKLYYTSFASRGPAQFAHIEELRVNPELFPDIHLYHPLKSMLIDPFAVTFSPVQIVRPAR
jgi:hypothetical protein